LLALVFYRVPAARRVGLAANALRDRATGIAPAAPTTLILGFHAHLLIRNIGLSLLSNSPD